MPREKGYGKIQHKLFYILTIKFLFKNQWFCVEDYRQYLKKYDNYLYCNKKSQCLTHYLHRYHLKKKKKYFGRRAIIYYKLEG